MSNISENIYFLKDDGLFKIEQSGCKRSVSLEDVLASKEKYSLLIDDKYFFYMGMENVSVSGKKLRDIAANYLGITFPGDMVKSFGVYQAKGLTIIFILSEELISLIKDNRNLFAGARKISSPFMELSSRYEEFVFSDSSRFYKKSGSNIFTFSGETDNYITSSDLFEEISEVKNSIRLPGISSGAFSKAPLIVPIAVLGLCYLMFVIGSVYSASSISKIGTFYEAALEKVYASAGVDKDKDPYGMLVLKSKNSQSGYSGKRVMEILSDLSSADRQGVNFSSLSIRDKAVRVEGTAENFAQVDTFKKHMEEKLKINVSMDDTKKTTNGVSFIMRYEQ